MPRIEEQRIDGPGGGKTMFVPPMEPYGAALMAAVFRSVGYRAEVLEESDETLSLGLKHTAGGECVPCPATVGALIKAMQTRKIPPEKVIFFMPTACGPCRFGQYAKLDTMIFERLGWGAIRVMSPSAENSYGGLDDAARMRIWHGIVVGDVFRKLGTRVRPYERERGATDAVLSEWFARAVQAFEKTDLEPVSTLLAQAVDAIARIPRVPGTRPLVGIVGEIFVRCNPFINHQLIRRIEELGGEAALAPVGEWLLYTNYIQGLIAREEGLTLKGILKRVRNWAETHFFFERWEHHYYDIAAPVIRDRREWPMAEVIEEGLRFMPWQFEGEAILTLGRASLFVKKDGAKAIVNASPMFCMPGTITTSIFPRLEQELGVPILCNFYDGSGDPNQSLVPVMHYLTQGGAK